VTITAPRFRTTNLVIPFHSLSLFWLNHSTTNLISCRIITDRCKTVSRWAATSDRHQLHLQHYDQHTKVDIVNGAHSLHNTTIQDIFPLTLSFRAAPYFPPRRGIAILLCRLLQEGQHGLDTATAAHAVPMLGSRRLFMGWRGLCSDFHASAM